MGMFHADRPVDPDLMWTPETEMCHDARSHIGDTETQLEPSTRETLALAIAVATGRARPSEICEPPSQHSGNRGRGRSLGKTE